MKNEQAGLRNFKARVSWQAAIVILGGLALFGSQWAMPNSELFAHVKAKLLSTPTAFAQPPTSN